MLKLCVILIPLYFDFQPLISLVIFVCISTILSVAAVGVITVFKDPKLQCDCVVLVRQYRPPMEAYTVEFPAGWYFRFLKLLLFLETVAPLLKGSALQRFINMGTCL